MLIVFGLLVGLIVFGPLACWLLGLFNPIGYMGHRPWSPEVKAARARASQRRTY